MFEDWTKEQILEEIEQLFKGDNLLNFEKRDVVVKDGEKITYVRAWYYLVELNKALLKLEKGKPPGIPPGEYEPVTIAIVVEVLNKQYKLKVGEAISIVEKFTMHATTPLYADTIKTYRSKYNKHPTFVSFTDRIVNKYPEIFPGLLPTDPEAAARVMLHSIKDGRMKITPEK